VVELYNEELSDLIASSEDGSGSGTLRWKKKIFKNYTIRRLPTPSHPQRTTAAPGE